MKTIGGLIFLLLVTVQAQRLQDAAADAIALELGAISRSVIDDTSFQNFKDGSRYVTFTLDLEGGGVTEFRLVSDFDGYLTLYSPSLELLQTNDDADDSDGNEENYESVVIAETSESGTYLIVASTYSAESSGALELSAKDIFVVDDTGLDGALTPPTSLDAVLNEADDIDDDARYYDTFTLELTAPTTVTITMTSEPIDTYLKILDESGNLIAENDDKEFVDDSATTDYDESLDFTLNSELTLDLEAGSYQIQALSYNTGYYQLFVQGEGDDEPVVTPTLTPSKPDAKPGSKPGN
jgi:hypothetical protein